MRVRHHEGTDAEGVPQAEERKAALVALEEAAFQHDPEEDVREHRGGRQPRGEISVHAEPEGEAGKEEMKRPA